MTCGQYSYVFGQGLRHRDHGQATELSAVVFGQAMTGALGRSLAQPGLAANRGPRSSLLTA